MKEWRKKRKKKEKETTRSQAAENKQSSSEKRDMGKHPSAKKGDNPLWDEKKRLKKLHE